MTIIPMKPLAMAAPVVNPDHLEVLSRALARWFVRRDNSFYDVEDLAHKRSRVDVETTAIHRFREDFPDIPLTNQLISAVFKRAIQTRHDQPEEMIMPWNGQVVCCPGNRQRIMIARGVATINCWTEPAYRTLAVAQPDYGTAGEFFDWMFPRRAEKDMFLNWLAWSLQNEGDKPNWAPFLFSSRMGTGKSALGRLLARLFGEANSITQNNIDKLTGRFNMSILRSKLVICEEVQLRAGSADANTLKTYITEKTAAAEQKGKELERIEQRVCMILTSNHMPFWIEAEDRRYYIINIDHDGYSRGARAEAFSQLVGRLEAWAEDPMNIARLYAALMARELPVGFSAKTLNVERDGTEIMRQVFLNGRATVLDRMQEYLDRGKWHAVAEADIVTIVTEKLRVNINTTKHLMFDLGWTKRAVKWGGVDYARQIWVRPGYIAADGKLHGPEGFEEDLAKHLEDQDGFGELDLIH